MRIRAILAGMAVVLCSGLGAEVRESSATVFLDGAVLYGTSERGVLRADFERGTITLVDAAGRAQEFSGQLLAIDRNTSTENFGLHFVSGPLAQRAGACASEGQAVQAGVNLVQSACTSGQSTACAVAITALDAAYVAYANCLQNLVE